MSAPIVIVSGCDGDTRRYRAWHAAESLAMAGRRVTVRTVDSDPPSPADLEGAAALILHRVAWRPDVARWIAAVRAGGGRVLYDTDDRVFDDAFAARAAALGTQAPPADYRRALEACDGCIAATAPLAEAVAALGRPAAVVRNAIDLELWRLSEAAWRRRRGGGERPRDGIVIGYASGTATHDADFRVCAPAVMALLEARPDVRLRVIGPLALGGAWDRFGPRVERVPFMPWRRLPEALAAFDINVAPLDLADPFCLAKSELKWFEAGAVGVPTIAAVTPAFRAAIRDGLDGFVAADVDGWRAALAALVADAPRRRAVGAAAREAVRDDYLSDRRAVEWAAALDALGAGGAGGHGAGRAAGPTSRPPAADHDVAAARPLILADDPTLERFAMGAEAVLAEHGVAAAASVGAVGPWLAARAAAIRTAAGRHEDPAAPDVAALPYPIDHRVFAPARTDDPAGRPPLLFDWALGRDSSRALALQALHAAADRVPRLAVRLFSSDAAAPPPDPAAIDRPGWRDLGPLDAAARAALFAGGGVLVAPCFGNVPRAVVEAMAAGVAVAAVDVPSVRWLLRDGATAALAAPDGDALGVAAARLLAEPARRERAVAAGRDAVARHSIGRHAAAADALARGGAVGPPPWTWQLDQLQPFGADPGPSLTDGRSIGLAFIARCDGLCRIDLRIGAAADAGAADEGSPAADAAPRWRPLDRAERAALELEIRPGLPAPGVTSERVAAVPIERRSDDAPRPRTSLDGPIDAAGEDWVRFTFAPLPESAGRWWTARLALRADRGAPPSVHVVGVAADAFADGYAVVDDAIVTGWSPAFRLWAAPPSATADILPEPAAEALLGALALVAVATSDAERREAAVAALWPVRAARWLARANAPLPPIDRRPWPPEAPALVKALGTLRHYGPLALARELRAMARWRRMDPAARAAARDQNTA